MLAKTLFGAFALMLCLALTACSSLMNQTIPSTPTSAQPAPREPVCHQNNDEGNWKVASSGMKVTVTHRYTDSTEVCEKAGNNKASENVVSAVKGSSLHNLVFGEKIVAAVDIRLDSGAEHSDKSGVNFSVI